MQLERCLRHIFAKYCTPRPPRPQKHDSTTLLTPPDDAILDAAGLDAWAEDTNGAPFSEETKEELREFMDVTEEGELTCVIYHSFISPTFLAYLCVIFPIFLVLIPVFSCRFKGFAQIYQLQTENDEEETWKDLVRAPTYTHPLCPLNAVLFHCSSHPVSILSYLSSWSLCDKIDSILHFQSNHGFDRTLALVSTRREEEAESSHMPLFMPCTSGRSHFHLYANANHLSRRTRPQKRVQPLIHFEHTNHRLAMTLRCP